MKKLRCLALLRQALLIGAAVCAALFFCSSAQAQAFAKGADVGWL